MVSLYIGAMGTDLCPVTAVISYMMAKTKPVFYLIRW